MWWFLNNGTIESEPNFARDIKVMIIMVMF